MASVPKKVVERLSKQLTTFQRVLSSAKDRDVNESDTVMIVTDMLGAIFGFDKYTEVTSEQAIRGTYCDLAVQLEGSVRYIIEVKAIGTALKENHLRQAVGYGANHGISWVVLTNGINWEIHRIKFERPIDNEQVCGFNILDLNPRKMDDLERLYLLCREGLAQAAIEEFHAHAQNVNRFVIAALIHSEPVLSVLRRELRRLSPETKVSQEEIQALLPEVMKRDVLEGDAFKQAERRIRKASQKALRVRREKESAQTSAAPETAEEMLPVEIIPEALVATEHLEEEISIERESL